MIELDFDPDLTPTEKLILASLDLTEPAIDELWTQLQTFLREDQAGRNKVVTWLAVISGDVGMDRTRMTESLDAAAEDIRMQRCLHQGEHYQVGLLLADLLRAVREAENTEQADDRLLVTAWLLAAAAFVASLRTTPL